MVYEKALAEPCSVGVYADSVAVRQECFCDLINVKRRLVIMGDFFEVAGIGSSTDSS